MAKNQVNVKQHPEAEILLFENHSHSSCENNKMYSRKQAKEQVCLNLWEYTINHNENEDENEKNSHRYTINRPTTTFIIFWDFLMFQQVFLSLQVKRYAIITYNHGIYELPHGFLNDLRLRHVRRWGSLSAHTRKKKTNDLRKWGSIEKIWNLHRILA